MAEVSKTIECQPLSIRFSAGERALLADGAQIKGSRTVSAFVREAALDLARGLIVNVVGRPGDTSWDARSSERKP